jgi:hypothetical protein
LDDVRANGDERKAKTPEEAIIRRESAGAQMARLTLSAEQVRHRNEQIVDYAKLHPEMTKTALGLKYGLSRETIASILGQAERRLRRNVRLAEKNSAAGLSVSE